MASVKIWNDNKYVYRNTFRGDPIVIPAGGFIEAEEQDAVLILGKLPNLIRDADGGYKPESYQMLRVEKPKVVAAMTSSAADLICNQCGEKSIDQVEQAKHILDKHMGDLAEKSRDEAGRKLQEALRKGK